MNDDALSPVPADGPVSPIEVVPSGVDGVRSRFASPPIEEIDEHLEALQAICPIETKRDALIEAGRDWWPITMHWALRGEVPAIASAIARPRSTSEIALLLAYCNEHSIAVTPAGGRSGVCGASIPLCGGIVLDMTNMAGVVHVDTTSLIAEVLPGTFGPRLERELNAVGVTLGHFPQSFDISTVGGWVACRSAGQYSTKYGKIEDMVCGLEVVLSSGHIVHTGVSPRAASGPDLDQLFIGSEGTLGVISRIWLRCHLLATREDRCAYAFADFASGIDACRRIVQRGGTPAVLRLYDSSESQRSHGGDGTSCTLLVLDEGDPVGVDATMTLVHEECLATDGCRPIDSAPVDRWMEHRNDTSALQVLTRKGFVVDTMEVAAPWSKLVDIYESVKAGFLSVDFARAASCHLSHSYADGACLYFSFAATPPADSVDAVYVAMWDAGTRAALSAGANLSHHHGIGLNRSRYVAQALGGGFDVLRSIKSAIDPNGILNPGKLGLHSSHNPQESMWPM